MISRNKLFAPVVNRASSVTGGWSYEKLNSSMEDPTTVQGKVVQQYRRLARAQLWRILLPFIALFCTAAIFLHSLVATIKYVRASGMLVPAYRTIPVVTQGQLDTVKTRQITMEQCLASYPGLFE